MKKLLVLFILSSLLFGACGTTKTTDEDTSLLEGIVGNDVTASDGTDENGDVPISEGPTGPPNVNAE